MVDAVLNQGLPAPIDVQVSGSNHRRRVPRRAAGVAAKIRAAARRERRLHPAGHRLPVAAARHRPRAGRRARPRPARGRRQRHHGADVEPDDRAELLGRSQERQRLHAHGAVPGRQRARACWTSRPSRCTRAARRQPTLLDAVTSITPITSPTEIDHYQIRRVIDIYVNPARRGSRRLATGIRGVLAATTLPAGVTVDVRGMVQGMEPSFTSFALRPAPRARAAVSDSRRAVPIVHRPAPDSARRAARPHRRARWRLCVTGTTLNVQSLMGVLMMVGMVVSNSILIVEFTHRLRGGRHAGAATRSSTPAASGCGRS